MTKLKKIIVYGSGAVLVAIGVTSFGTAALARCPGDTQSEMNQCSAEDYKRADADLTKAYHKLEKSAGLITAERAWIAYRDAECAYETSSVEGGSMAPLVNATCMTQLTKERTSILKSDAAQ